MDPDITVEFSEDYGFFDQVLSDPEIFDKVSPDGVEALTVSNLVKNSVFILVRKENQKVGFFVCEFVGGDTWRVHTNLMKECRGTDAIRAGKKGCDLMFRRTPATRLVSECHGYAPEALQFAKGCGFKSDFVKCVPWVKNKQFYDITCVSLTLQEWIRFNYKAFVDIGKEFHDRLHSQLGRQNHPDDSVHNGFAGLAMDIALRGGMPAKAQAIYNDWALQSGYELVTYLGSRGPIQVWDICTLIIEGGPDMKPNAIRNLKCQ